MLELNKIYHMDCLEGMKLIDDKSVDMIVTSPPYWGLRDYKTNNILGNELDPVNYIVNLCNIFDEAHRVLKESGTLWVNISDSYFRNGGKSKGKNEKAKVGNTRNGIQKGNCKVPNGYLEKSLALIPQRFVVEMSSRGWIVRNQIIWHKPNAMPQPINDRFANDYEIVFLFSKIKKYKFNLLKENITGNERIKRAVWSINTKPNKTLGHIAPFPIELVNNCIIAGTNERDIILDPFMGSGTTAIAAINTNRQYIGFELSEKYYTLANERIDKHLESRGSEIDRTVL